MDYDYNKIKNLLTDKDIEKILISLGSALFQKDDTQMIYYSVCHHGADCLNHKPKLYYYQETQSLFCYSCSSSFDIISLVKEVNNFKFMSQGADYIIDLCNLPFDRTQRINSTKQLTNWQTLTKFINPNYSQDKNIKTFDKNILHFFPKIYHTSFIDEGITIETMKKFNIRFYPLKQQILLPVMENNQLIGVHCRNLLPEMIEQGYKYLPLKMADDTDYAFNTSQTLYGFNENKYNIQSKKEVFLFEAPKSVLQMETIQDINTSLGMFGVNLSKYNRNRLVQLGIEDVYVCLDKQYRQTHIDSIDQEGKNIQEKTTEFIKYQKWVNKIANLFQGYCRVWIIFDTDNLLDYKDSPSDKGKEIWQQLWKTKILI